MFANEIERPLKMPENYDFSTRKINWNNYKKEYLLRTDAVWEKEKLRSYFYSLYKGVTKYDIYIKINNKNSPLFQYI